MKKFQVPDRVPKLPNNTSKSIRFPNTMIADIENAIRGKNCSFSAFVLAATQKALDDLQEEL